MGDSSEVSSERRARQAEHGMGGSSEVRGTVPSRSARARYSAYVAGFSQQLEFAPTQLPSEQL